MTKLVYGVGVNDLGYRVHVREELPKSGGKRIQKTVFLCKYYEVWKDMLKRCYSEKYLERNPSYIGTSVCNEWLYATAFKKWMEKQDWQDKSLDKDIIVPGSKLYSPETCAFVLPATNLFVTARDACRGDYPIGVHLVKRTGKYKAYCGNPLTRKREYLESTTMKLVEKLIVASHHCPLDVLRVGCPGYVLRYTLIIKK
jgi:CRISPR/Cas system-associated endoribonuclease Cas2